MRIAAVGDNCMDVYQALGRAYPGGNPVNVAVYFTRLGGNASYTGAVGSDSYGRLMIDSLNAKGVDTSHVKILPGSTAVTQVELLENERVFGEYDEGVLADFKLSEEDVEFLCGHDMVVTGLWGKVEGELSRIRERGIPVVFDCATRPDDPASRAAIPETAYLFFSEDGGDRPALREKLRGLHSRGPRIVTATLGEKGSLSFDGTSFFSCGIVPCRVEDTLGAGDSYIAGFLYGILEGRSIPDCMLLGAKASSETLAYQGAW